MDFITAVSGTLVVPHSLSCLSLHLDPLCCHCFNVQSWSSLCHVLLCCHGKVRTVVYADRCVIESGACRYRGLIVFFIMAFNGFWIKLFLIESMYNPRIGVMCYDEIMMGKKNKFMGWNDDLSRSYSLNMWYTTRGSQSKTTLSSERVVRVWGQCCVLSVSSLLTSYVTPSSTGSVLELHWIHGASGEPLDFLQNSACWCHPLVRNVVPTLTASEFILRHGEGCDWVK